jgi:hypothetical protein
MRSRLAAGCSPWHRAIPENIEYCYLLDQLASAVDTSTMMTLKHPVWQQQIAFARTAAVLALIHVKPAEYSQTLQHWAAVELLTQRELASQQSKP